MTNAAGSIADCVGSPTTLSARVSAKSFLAVERQRTRSQNGYILCDLIRLTVPRPSHRWLRESSAPRHVESRRLKPLTWPPDCDVHLLEVDLLGSTHIRRRLLAVGVRVSQGDVFPRAARAPREEVARRDRRHVDRDRAGASQAPSV